MDNFWIGYIVGVITLGTILLIILQEIGMKFLKKIGSFIDKPVDEIDLLLAVCTLMGVYFLGLGICMIIFGQEGKMDKEKKKFLNKLIDEMPTPYKRKVLPEICRSIKVNAIDNMDEIKDWLKQIVSEV